MLEVSFSGPISCELGIAGNWNGNEPLDFIFNSGSFPCPGGACIGPITKLGAGGEVYVYGGAGIFGIWEGSFGGHWGLIGCILEGSESMILWQAGDANDRSKDNYDGCLHLGDMLSILMARNTWGVDYRKHRPSIQNSSIDLMFLVYSDGDDEEGDGNQMFILVLSAQLD